MTDLGALYTYSSGLAINRSGVAVGNADVRSNNGLLTYHAVIYSGGQVHDLNNRIPAGSGWVLSAATSIDDTGRIAGYGTFKNAPHAFLLTPQ